ncbi:hypothetical protein [Brachybacterium alimentarium]|uniref:hypothetical protein n=1 Tax=Brachybacterium alimentarium TaxID=47845 RepID=UPI000DF2A1CD|nr:hypothetical protein [Brachybacterium alimentarium]RCS71364.1 hypothetical protein CIK68_10295 [Brachybacterium alimentarium]RCS87405.1 hypothetical protein CIK67_02830 [Brachybacterium alimentarium]
MTENPHGDDLRSAGSGLPDFTVAEPDALPDHEGQQHVPDLSDPSPRSRRRTLATVLSIVGSGVVLLAVLALVLSQTVFRSVLDQDPEAYDTADRTGEGHSEYVPNPEDPDIAPPPPIFTEKPTTDCTVPEPSPAQRADPGTIRGGDLQYTIPPTWKFAWGSGALPYMTEVDAQGRNVEGSWYSVVNLGRVVWPEEEGGYPGMESAAVSIFQCYATTSGVVAYFGDHPEVTDYRSEAFTVDGSPAWIVQATYHFEDPAVLSTTDSSVVTAVVVEGPDGPSALASDVAADQPEHVQELEDIIDSLEVVE